MRILLVTLLAVSGFQASAQQPACAQALERMHARYFDEIEEAQSTARDLKWGLGPVTAAAAYCLWQTKSGVPALLCGGAYTLVGAGGALYKNKLENRIQRLEDGYKMYEAYYRIRGENLADEAVHDLMLQVAASPAQENNVASEFLVLVDSGELCDGGQTVTKSWEDVVALLKQKRY